MSLEGDGIPDECAVTALQIFEYCGADSCSSLRVDALMDKFAPFIKTNKSEYSYLKSLLDPEQNNPEITIPKLAETLNKYSESQKVKVDLEESFNLRNGQAPHDSDSGISTDGFQIIEELQCELREKTHLAHQLRSQLEFTDRQHEEAIFALTAERDSLRSHLNMLREENLILTHVRRDYEDVCERLCNSERALDDVKRQVDCSKKKLRVMTQQVCTLETEKLTLSELLAKSKEECHRINDRYANRQSALLEQNERLRSDHADLSARLQDHEEVMQTVLKEKIQVEMELKEMLNKTNQIHMKMDRSIDISYTEDQMLTALDSLNADSRFCTDKRIDESLKDEGLTNMSLFDEMRLSYCNMSHNITEVCTDNDLDNREIATQTYNTYEDCVTDTNFINVEVQTDINESKITCDRVTQTNVERFKNVEIQTNTERDSQIQTDLVIKIPTDPAKLVNAQIQTNDTSTNNIETQTEMKFRNRPKLRNFKIPIKSRRPKNDAAIQTDENTNNNNITKCFECDKFDRYTTQLEMEYKNSTNMLSDVKNEIEKYEDNLSILKKIVDEGNDRNSYLKSVVDDLRVTLSGLEAACSKQKEEIEKLSCSVASVEVQTEFDQVSTYSQTDLPCSNCVKRNGSHRLRRYLWDPLKCLFQLFAVICFIFALSALYGVSRRWQSPCTPLAPWSWLQPHDFMDLFFRIEYIADVPM